MARPMGGTATTQPPTPSARPRRAVTFTAIPLVGLARGDAVPFPLYLSTAENTWVLYRPEASELDESHIGRLTAEGVHTLFIRDQDRAAYFARVENELEAVLHDRSVPLHGRADVLCGVATKVADDLLTAPDKESVRRAQKVMIATSSLLLRENQGFQAVRRVLSAGPDLKRHSLTVGFLCMGLARLLLTGDSATLTTAGLAGLLHDVGKVGHEDLEHDPEHAARGASYLVRLGLAGEVVRAVKNHHECVDGSGFPQGLQGGQIPELARIVGIVDIFDKVYNSHEPRVGVFDALRILAQAYRGCFDNRMAQGLVRLFR
ncbi:MAG TPA: HD domain-containing protein [bacterium]|nr:HD domain-containing protein [bacterium]